MFQEMRSKLGIHIEFRKQIAHVSFFLSTPPEIEAETENAQRAKLWGGGWPYEEFRSGLLDVKPSSAGLSTKRSSGKAEAHTYMSLAGSRPHTNPMQLFRIHRDRPTELRIARLCEHAIVYDVWALTFSLAKTHAIA